MSAARFNVKCHLPDGSKRWCDCEPDASIGQLKSRLEPDVDLRKLRFQDHCFEHTPPHHNQDLPAGFQSVPGSTLLVQVDRNGPGGDYAKLANVFKGCASDAKGNLVLVIRLKPLKLTWENLQNNQDHGQPLGLMPLKLTWENLQNSQDHGQPLAANVAEKQPRTASPNAQERQPRDSSPDPLEPQRPWANVQGPPGRFDTVDEEVAWMCSHWKDYEFLTHELKASWANHLHHSHHVALATRASRIVTMTFRLMEQGYISTELRKGTHKKECKLQNKPLLKRHG